MARNKGTFKYPGTMQVQSPDALDARTVVDTVSDLTNLNVWKADDGNAYVYKGLRVSVLENDSLWMLTNPNNITSISSWKRLDDNSSTAITNLQTALNNKVDKVAGKGLSTNDFDADYLKRLRNTGLYGRMNNFGSAYGVRELFDLTTESTNTEIRSALKPTDSDPELTAAILDYCVENGSMIYDVGTTHHIVVHKTIASDTKPTWDLIQIDSGAYLADNGGNKTIKLGIPSVKVITLQFNVSESTWSVLRVINEQIALKSNTLEKIPNLIRTYNDEPGVVSQEKGISIWHDDSLGLSIMGPSGSLRFNNNNNLFINSTVVDSEVDSSTFSGADINGSTINDATISSLNATNISISWDDEDNKVFISNHSSAAEGILIGGYVNIDYGVTIGEDTNIAKETFIGADSDNDTYGKVSVLDEGEATVDLRFGNATIGNNTVIGDNVTIPNNFDSSNFASVVQLTQDEYDALTTKNPRTLYCIIESSNPDTPEEEAE